VKSVKSMTRGEKVIAFIERYCRVPEGAHVGANIKLIEFQKKFILDVYDNPSMTRRGYLSIGRKNGKTALVGCLLLAHIAGPEAELNSQVVSGALSRDQASIVFNLMVKIVNLSPELTSRVRVIPSSKRLVGVAKNVEYRALSADGKTNQGLSPKVALLDEIGQIKGPSSAFVDAVVTSQGAHERPILLAISTQAANDADLFSLWLDDAQNDPQTVCHLYAAPADCDLMDAEAWKAANPALDVFRSLEDVKKQAEMAKRVPYSEGTFRNLTLNQRVERVSPLIAKSVWDANSGQINPGVFKEYPVYCGLDLSTRNDLTAFAMIACDGEKWHVKTHYWTPENGLKDRSNRDKAPYDVWVRQGLITATPGASVDYEHVAQEIADLTQGLNVQAIGFDSWHFEHLMREMSRIGSELPFVKFAQGFKGMSPAIDILESRLLNEKVLHGNNPVLRMCMHNARAEPSSTGLRMLNKLKSTGRIDGIVALAMAFGVSSEFVEGQAEIDEWLNDPLIL
jgi:phage terminase large subunit-like protein